MRRPTGALRVSSLHPHLFSRRSRALSEELVGHYRIVATLGSGGMGVVRKAIDTRLNRPVAIKTIREADAANIDAVLRLRAEALAAASLDHPYICKIYELLETGSTTLVVMEFIEGETLADLLSRRRPQLIETLRYGSEIAEGLANAHGRGIIHRDVKPGNVMITSHGHVKLLDFGVARINDPGAITQSGLTLPGHVPGTPHYIAPEQALGQPFDARADLFALGVLLFRCLTGQLPFEGETRDAYVQQLLAGRSRSIDQLAPDTPEDVREIVRRCLSRDPEQRPESAAWVVGALRRSAEMLSTGTAVVPVHPSRGLPKWALQVAAIALIFVAVAVAASRWPARDNEAGVRRELVPVVTWPSAEADGRISPDGRWLSFISDKQGSAGLFVQSMDQGEPVAVSIPGVVLSHAWSTSGNEVAAIVGQADRLFITIVPAFFGGTPRLTVPLPAESGSPAVRRWVGGTIFVDGIEQGKAGRSLWRVSAETGTFDLVSATWSLPFTVRGLDVSMDATRLLFAGTVGGHADLWTAAVDGSGLSRLTDDAAVERDPLWIDQHTIAFVSTRGGQLDLWQMNLSTRRLVQLTSSLTVEQPSGASPDGSVIAFQERATIANLWRLDLTTGAARQLTADALSDYWPSMAANGSRLAFQRARPVPAEGYQYFDARVMMAAVTGAALEPLPVDDGFGAALSYDGEWLAYYQRLAVPDRLRILVRHTRTGQIHAVTEEGELPAFNPSQPVDWMDQNLVWRPSSPELYFVTKGPDGHRVQTARPGERVEVETVAQSGTHRLRNLRFAPAGESLSYQADPKAAAGQRELRMLRLADRQSIVVARHAAGEKERIVIGWTGADRLLVLSAIRTGPAGASDLQFAETSTTGSVVLATVADGFPQTVRLDAERRRLFVTRVVDGVHNVVVVSLDDGRVRQLTANENAGVSFSGIHPMGKDAILFARDERKRDIWIVRRTSSQ